MKLKTLALIAASSAMTLPAFAADPANPEVWDITATDTLFGTGISNTASLSYSVNGTDIDETSNTVDFKVDRKIIFSVTDNYSSTTPIAVNAGGTASTTYTLLNDSNAPISFKLPIPPVGTEYKYGSVTITSATPVASPNLVIDLLAGNLTDDTDKIDITIEISVANDATSGTAITSSLILVAVEPTTAANIGTVAGVTAGDAIAATPTTVVWDEDIIQTISIAGLLDGTSVELTSDQDFIVSASDLSIVKTVAILSDPISGTTNPKAIPGAVVEYTLTITNSGLITATGVDLTDDVPAVFDFSDSYTETYTLDGSATVPGLVVDGVTSITTLSFNGLSIDAATDITLPATYGSIVIKFTVKLP